MSFDLSVIPHKNIILAVTGGIAAYKSAILVRRLKDYGFDVRVVMTQGAQAFITPLLFRHCRAIQSILSCLTQKLRQAWGILNWHAGLI